MLIGVENGKRIKNTSGVYYNDEYVRRGNNWLISGLTFHVADPGGDAPGAAVID